MKNIEDCLERLKRKIKAFEETGYHQDLVEILNEIVEILERI